MPPESSGTATGSRILVVTHETSRTGAPRIALLVTQVLSARGHRVAVVSRRPGPLLVEFEQVAPTDVEPGYRIRARLGRVRRWRRPAALIDTLWAVATLVRHDPDLVYVNSMAAGPYARAGAWLRRRVVLHVHESTDVAEVFLRRDRTRAVLRSVTLVACSPSVRHDLGVLDGLDARAAEAVVLLPSVPDDARVSALGALTPDHPYDAGETVVGCCGAVEERKGADLWAEIAAGVRAELGDLDLRFVWVGEVVDESIAARAHGVEFIGPSDNPYAHMSRFDVSTLPSRDDPFPLVVLESMLLGTPVVAFDVGGVAEQIGGAGVVVAAGDVRAFVDAVVGLLRDSGRRDRLGGAARDRATDHFSTASFARGLEDLIEETSRAGRT